MASVVQTWGEPASPTSSVSYNSSHEQLASLARRAALNNDIQQPRGHSVSFHYNPAVESHHFGRSHPMKPWRLALTKQLVLGYGLHYAMSLYTPRAASRAELAAFHKEDYLAFISEITPDNMLEREGDLKFYNFGDDCPVFDGLYNYCTLYTGASLSAARTLAAACPPDTGSCDIAINWSGGLHHAKKGEASGFCYVNDIVLAILELLRTHPRVLYIDIDVHHGDGVEAAFASSDRVFTLSYHKYDPAEFFPGTGGLHETGPTPASNPGSHTTLNVPLKDGIDDDQYTALFESITSGAVNAFSPTAVVLQCGADSLGGDRLGKFNLNITAHGACVAFVKKLGLPTLILGGGGYTARNVARLWTHETALCTDTALPSDIKIPEWVPYHRAFAGEDKGGGLLLPPLSNLAGRRHTNEHTREDLEHIVRTCHEHLRYLRGAPSVQMRRIPNDVWKVREEIDAALRDEANERDVGRRDRERGIGGRGQLVA